MKVKKFKKAVKKIIVACSIISIILESSGRDVYAFYRVVSGDFANEDNSFNLKSEDMYVNIVPSDVIEYAESRFEGMVETVIKEKKYFDVDINSKNNLILNDPFVIYSSSGLGTQDPIYYFPVSDKDEIIMVLYVLNNEGEYSAAISTELVDELEQIGIKKYEEYIYYENGEEIIAENNSNKIIMNEYESDVNIFKDGEQNKKEFEAMTYEEKAEYVCNTYANGNEEIINNEDDEKDKSRGFSVKRYNEVKLDMDGCLVKQKHNNCWAASVATVVRYMNYKKYNKLTAEQVCDKLKIDYDKGGSIYDKQKALRKYGINCYDYCVLDQINFDCLKFNILEEKPVMMSCKTANYRHATTIIGYTTYGGINQIVLHNPGDDKVVSVEYKNSGTSFPYGNHIWKWEKTLCAYYGSK